MTTGQILTNHDSKRSWVKDIQVCPNEGLGPFPMGDNNQITKILGRNLRIFYSKTTGPFSTKVGTKSSCV